MSNACNLYSSRKTKNETSGHMVALVSSFQRIAGGVWKASSGVQTHKHEEYLKSLWSSACTQNKKSLK